MYLEARHRVQGNIRASGERSGHKPWSKLLEFPLITPIVVPHKLLHITSFKEFKL